MGMGLGSNHIAMLAGFSPVPGSVRLQSHIGNARLLGTPDVRGFEATGAETLVVDGLPEGTLVPADALAVIAASRRLDTWLDTGRRVREWSAAQGLAGASWYSDDDDELRLPPELAGRDLPTFVTTWLAEAGEIEQIIAAFG